MVARRDVIGRRYGRYVVLADGPSPRHLVLARCDCGNERWVRLGNLRSLHTRSCGCLNADSLRKRSTKHGCLGMPEYTVWKSMRQRCSDPNKHNYHRYGGRGITVCARWSSFDAFITDMGPRPSSSHSLDRRDNNGPYTPSNCRWATLEEQNNNQARTVRLTLRGECLSISQWARRIGAAPKTITYRLARGWPLEDALTQPPSPNVSLAARKKAGSEASPHRPTTPSKARRRGPGRAQR